VRVLNADGKAKRIALSMKTQESGRSASRPAPPPKKKVSLEDQLAALNSRFRVK
jgi:hypothetical protein